MALSKGKIALESDEKTAIDALRKVEVKSMLGQFGAIRRSVVFPPTCLV